MTSEQEEQLMTKVDEILLILKGPEDDPRKGLVWKTAQHDDDLNGVGKAPGLKEIVSDIKDKVYRYQWWFAGLIAGVSALIAFAGWVLSNWSVIKQIKP